MKTEIGTEEISSKDFSEIPQTGIEELDTNITDIDEGKFYKASGRQNKTRAISTYKYFMDMKKHFSAAYNLLKPDSNYCLVIGDNSICKVIVPTSKYLIQIAENEGFTKKHSFEILLRNRTLNLPRNVNWSGKIKTDKIITLKN